MRFPNLGMGLLAEPRDLFAAGSLVSDYLPTIDTPGGR